MGKILQFKISLVDSKPLYLRELELKKGDSFAYLYDFGDDWLHHLEVDIIAVGALSAPSCLRGKNACPPEDCGCDNKKKPIRKFGLY